MRATGRVVAGEALGLGEQEAGFDLPVVTLELIGEGEPRNALEVVPGLVVVALAQGDGAEQGQAQGIGLRDDGLTQEPLRVVDGAGVETCEGDGHPGDGEPGPDRALWPGLAGALVEVVDFGQHGVDLGRGAAANLVFEGELIEARELGPGCV